MNTPPPPPHDAWLEILLKLLDWPFLLAVVLIVFFLLFKTQLKALLNRSDILLSWAGQSIRLRDLPKEIDKEIDPIRDEVEGLKEGVASARASSTKAEGDRPLESHAASPADALRVMKDALRNPKFRWRSVDRLAAIAYLTEPEAARLLQSDPEVVFGYGKSKKPVARLRAR